MDEKMKKMSEAELTEEIKKTNELLKRGGDLIAEQARFVAEHSTPTKKEEVTESGVLVKMAGILSENAARIVNYNFAVSELWAVYSILILARHMPGFQDVDPNLLEGFLTHCRDVWKSLGLTEDEAAIFEAEFLELNGYEYD